MRFRLLGCLAKAIVKNGVKFLCGLVPGGEVLFEIASDAWEDYREGRPDDGLRAELGALAQAPAAEVRQEAELAAQAAAAHLPADERQKLAAYLGQVPAMIRRSLRRPSDPTGTTVPVDLPLRSPEDLLPFLPPALTPPPPRPVREPRAKREQEAPRQRDQQKTRPPGMRPSPSASRRLKRRRDQQKTRPPGRWRLWVSLMAVVLIVGVLGAFWLSGLFRGPLGKSFTNSIGMEFTWIEPGTFRMGSPDSDKDARSDEKPQHEVEITKGYYLGTYPVTRGQFAAFVKDAHYQTEAEKASDASTWQKPSGLRWPADYVQTDNDPVVEASWNDAKAFCEWLSKKEGRTYELPTEAEWEYACRAGTPTAYSFGDDPKALGDYAWFYRNSEGRTHPVGRKKANPWGLCDMHGNVWQWCADGYGPYQGGPIKDPKGIDSSNIRVRRGGSWFKVASGCRSANRDNGAPAYRLDVIGFRVVLRSAPRTP